MGPVKSMCILVVELEVSSVEVRINEYPVRIVRHKSENVQPWVNL